jgi:hypothetical protein
MRHVPARDLLLCRAMVVSAQVAVRSFAPPKGLLIKIRATSLERAKRRLTNRIVAPEPPSGSFSGPRGELELYQVASRAKARGKARRRLESQDRQSSESRVTIEVPGQRARIVRLPTNC